MKKQFTTLCATSILCLSLTGCWGGDSSQPSPSIDVHSTPSETASVKTAIEPFTFEVDPETFAIDIIKDGVHIPASVPLPKAPVTNVVRIKDSVKWTYPNQVNVSVVKQNEYLDIRIESIGAAQFQWPSVKSDSYILPFGEGKQIPAADVSWREFLKDQTLSWSESFSMDFFAQSKSQLSLVYVVTNKFNNDIHFDASPDVTFQFTHDFPSLNKDKSYGFRLYVTKNDPQQIVQPYKNYVSEHGKIVTLQEKAKLNPNITKLYGAPQIYLWSETILTDPDVKWTQLRELLPKLGPWLSKLLSHTTDGSAEFDQVVKQLSKQDYLDNYQKKVVLTALNQVLKMRELYNPTQFPTPDEEARKLIGLGVDKLSEEKLYDLNKLLLKSVLKEAVSPVLDWGQADSTKVIQEMQEAGIPNAWLGLPNWSSGLMNPRMVSEANKIGYLIAPYDSYHSIQEKGDPSWNTAFFPDTSLYENATITGQNGKKVAGFLQRGRKLNPTLAMPSVKDRVAGILQDGIGFNSWFVDCDATGEIYDDYTPAHLTTQQQDLNDRLARLDYFAKEKNMVVGSEGGNDFAASVIAYAQGIESPVIAWGDPDMRDKKDSPYYVGGYYARDGGIPERYGKPVPIKPLYEHVYMDPAYSLPLYKLIYNDAIITTNHWEWGNNKIKGEEADRMLYDLLYNVPPLYHLDRVTWEKDKASMLDFLNVWSPFHREAVLHPMSEFTILTEDRLVQSARYGDELKVLVNFSDSQVTVAGEVIPAKSAVLYQGKQRKVFEAAANVKL
ncbi:hypothetical protein A8709_28800 [Paenibacillus pectinilyticus]|uniref:Glycoside hydrolase n=1 Tax=Paenibacillus pectinilyticus TaxID=512399 RepID=A0A1C0ZUW4_9BACL|nr:glycoside hydrolase [Paenibacillus pectinilyticus]OCT11867.1 hypothetical protein A8709_28800 [Paenibacillus pectinilyticus]